jgi:hypothetical protein
MELMPLRVYQSVIFRTAIATLALMLSAGASGCGGAAKPAEVPSAEAPAAEQRSASQASTPSKGGKGGKTGKADVSQELGEIDPQEAERAFGRIFAKLAACHKSGLRRIEALAGDLKFFVRIGQDGKTRFAYLEESSLGDSETERCMLEAVALASWPKPQGGEAEARKAYRFDAGDAREPAAWESEKVHVALAKHERELKSCMGDLNGSFKITMYVEPDKKDGKVLAVGMATKSQSATGKVSCLTEVLGAMKLPSPGSYLAKVSFTL